MTRRGFLTAFWLSFVFFTVMFQVTHVKAAPVVDANGGVVGRRPAGCPHRFCGCEASLFLFGRIRPELNLAANWIRKFPRTVPVPRMAAARSGHVMVLLRHIDGDNWLVHDGNSGGGLTREHVRSIRGYVIVNPGVSNELQIATQVGFGVAHY